MSVRTTRRSIQSIYPSINQTINQTINQSLISRSINQTISRTNELYRCRCQCRHSQFFSTSSHSDVDVDNVDNVDNDPLVDQSISQSINQSIDQSTSDTDIKSRSSLFEQAQSDPKTAVPMLISRYSNTFTQSDFNKLVRWCREKQAYTAAIDLLKLVNQLNKQSQKSSDRGTELEPVKLRKVIMVSECFNEFLTLFISLNELKIAQELVDMYFEMPFQSPNGSNQRAVKKFAPRFGAVKIQPNHVTYNLIIKFLTESNQLDKALSLATHLLDNTVNHSTDHTAKPVNNQSSLSRSKESVDQTIHFDEFTCGALLSVFVKSRQFDQVQKIEQLIFPSIKRTVNQPNMSKGNLATADATIHLDASILSMLMEANLLMKRYNNVLIYFDKGLKLNGASVNQSNNQFREPAFSYTIQAASISKNHKRVAAIYQMASRQANNQSNKQTTNQSSSSKHQTNQPILTSTASYEFLFYSLHEIHQFNTVIEIYRSLVDKSINWRGWAIKYIVQSIKQTGDIQYLPRLLAHNLESNPVDPSVIQSHQSNNVSNHQPNNNSSMSSSSASQNQSTDKHGRVDIATLETALEACLNHTLQQSNIQSADQSINQTVRQSTPMFITLIQLYKRHSMKLSINMYIQSIKFFLHFGEAAQVEKVRQEMINQSIKKSDLNEQQLLELSNCLIQACHLTGDWKRCLELIHQLQEYKKSLKQPKKQSIDQTIDRINQLTNQANSQRDTQENDDDDDDEWDFSDELIDRTTLNGGLCTLAAHDEWGAVLELFDQVMFQTISHSVDILSSNSSSDQSNKKSNNQTNNIIPTLSSCQIAIHASMQLKDWAHALMIYQLMQSPEWSVEHSKEKILSEDESIRALIDRTVNSSDNDSLNNFSVDEESMSTLIDSIIYCCYQLNDAKLANPAFKQSIKKSINQSTLPSTITTMLRIWTDSNDDQSISQLFEVIDEDNFEQIEMRAVEQSLKGMFNRIISQTNEFLNQTDQSNEVTSAQLMDEWQTFTDICARVSHLMISVGAISTPPTNSQLSDVPRDQRNNQYINQSNKFIKGANALNTNYTFETFPLVVRPSICLMNQSINQAMGINHFDEISNVQSCSQLIIQLIAWMVVKDVMITRLLQRSDKPSFDQSINQSNNESNNQTNKCCDVLIIPPDSSLINNADRLIEESIEQLNVYYGSLNVRKQSINQVMAMSEERTKMIKHAESAYQSTNQSKKQARSQRIHRNYAEKGDAQDDSDDLVLNWGVLVKAKEIQRIVDLMKKEQF